MQEYVEELIKSFLEECKGQVTTPAANHLFETRATNMLCQDKKDLFHTLVAKGLYLCKRGRPDIQTAIAFLSTRVTKPDKDDWKKLKRVISYLNSTK